MEREEYIRSLSIDNRYIESCIDGFIQKHTELYGRFIPETELVARLKENLKAVKIDYRTEPSDKGLKCRYRSFGENTLYISFDTAALQNINLRADIRMALFRELTDAAYRRKVPGPIPYECQVFGVYEASASDAPMLISGTALLRPHILNHIAGNLLDVPTDVRTAASRQIAAIEEQMPPRQFMRSIWDSDDASFRELFQSYSIDDPYNTFTTGLEALTKSGDPAILDNLHSTFNPNTLNDIIRSNAPFWKERQYRRFLEGDMEESEFAVRLQKSFAQESEVHPELREAIWRGENTALVRLVATEYAYDLALSKSKELERELPAEELSEEQAEEEIAPEITDSQEELDAFFDELEAEREEALAKEEARSQKAALNKKRALDYAKRTELYRKALEEQRRLVEQSYSAAAATQNYKAPEYEQVKYPEYPDEQVKHPEYPSEQARQQYEYETQKYRSEQTSYHNEALEHGSSGDSSVEYKSYEYDVQKYDSSEYRTPEHNSPKYDSPEYKAPDYDIPKYDSPEYETRRYEERRYRNQEYTSPKYETAEQSVGGYKPPEYHEPEEHISKYEAQKREEFSQRSQNYESRRYEELNYDAGNLDNQRGEGLDQSVSNYESYRSEEFTHNRQEYRTPDYEELRYERQEYKTPRYEEAKNKRQEYRSPEYEVSDNRVPDYESLDYENSVRRNHNYNQQIDRTEEYRDRKYENEQTERYDRNEQTGRNEQTDRYDRKEQDGRNERNERYDQSDRNDRRNQDDRNERNERRNQGDRNDRNDRNDRRDQGGRNDQNDRNDRRGQGDRNDRNDRNDQNDRNDEQDRRQDRTPDPHNSNEPVFGPKNLNYYDKDTRFAFNTKPVTPSYNPFNTNNSEDIPFTNNEESKKKAREHFQRIGENTVRAANRIRYVSNVTGYTSFIIRTNQMVRNFIDAEIRNSDDVGDTFYTINTTRRKAYAVQGLVVNPFMHKVDKLSSMNRFVKADVHRSKIALNLSGIPSEELKAEYKSLLVESNARFKHAIRNKWTRTEFLESCGVFDYSSPKLKEELRNLTRLKKSGRLTDVQARRLSSIQSGISVSQVKPRIKALLKKKKDGKFTAREMAELENLICAREVLESGGGLAGVRRAIGSGFILATDSARKSSDLGMHGLVKIVDFAENPYTRASIKASMKFSRSTLRLSKKLAKSSGRLVLNHTAPGRIVKKAGIAAEKATKEFTKKKIQSLADSTVGRFSKKSFNIGKKILGKIRSPFNGKVSGKIRKVLDVVTWPVRKLKQMVNAIRSLVAKLALILGGFFLTMFMFIIILDVAGAALSIIFDEVGPDNKINLSPYIKVLQKKNSEFTKEVKNFDPGGRYDRVYTNLEMEDNTKEILSMMAVRFEQDIVEYHTPNEVRNGKCDNCVNNRTETRCKGHRDEAFAYIENLYDLSHDISVSESMPYSCGKTDKCTRREEYTKYVSFSGYTAEQLNNIDTSKYKRIYRDKEGVPLGGDKVYYRCPGDHLNATISSSVLRFDEIFYVDGGGGSYGTMGAQPLANGKSLSIPSGLGKLHTYMGWSTITSKTSKQYKLRSDAGEKYDNEGFARIGDRYVIACTSTFGRVGDYVDFYQSDGSVIKGIIGDIKNPSDPGCNKWGHQDGKVIVEFVVNYKTWYKNGAGSHANPGTRTCHPGWNKELTKCVNRGNYWGKTIVDSGSGSSGDKGSSGKTTAAQKKVASYAAKNISTQPTTLNYCAAWVSGVYQAAGFGYPGGDARDFWLRWKSMGSSSPSNIPVGAVVVGSGVGSAGAIYGHVGIYIGNNMVAENIGRHNVTSLDNWIARNKQYNSSLGKKGFVGWVWPGKVLGSGTDGSYGTEGYTGPGVWDDDHIEWAKLIYEQDWAEMYTGFKDIELDWSGSALKVDSGAQKKLKSVMDDVKGSRYVPGGVGPDEFDCSGLVYYVFNESGIYEFDSRPTSKSLAKMSIPIKEKDAKFGDLVIWSNSKGAYHVAIYCGGGMVFEAANKDAGVRYHKLYDKDKAKYYRLPAK